jgi:hypothetical protein
VRSEATSDRLDILINNAGIGTASPRQTCAEGFETEPWPRHQPDLFAADNHRRQKLSPLIDRINDRYGRCAIGFGLFRKNIWSRSLAIVLPARRLQLLACPPRNSTKA